MITQSPIKQKKKLLLEVGSLPADNLWRKPSFGRRLWDAFTSSLGSENLHRGLHGQVINNLDEMGIIC